MTGSERWRRGHADAAERRRRPRGRGRHQGRAARRARRSSMPANDPIDPTREQLVQDLAAQAGLVLRNERLTAAAPRAPGRSAGRAEAPRHGAGRGAPQARAEHPRRRPAAARRARRSSQRLAEQLDRSRPAKAKEMLAAAPGRHGSGPRRPARPRPRHLPAAARRQGAGGRARGPGAEVADPRDGRRRRRRPPTPGRRGGRVLLGARGAAERREVRGGDLGAACRSRTRRTASCGSRCATTAGDSTRPRPATARVCRASPTGSARSTDGSRSRALRGRRDPQRQRPGGGRRTQRRDPRGA